MHLPEVDSLNRPLCPSIEIEQLVESLSLKILSRPPLPEEKKAAMQYVQDKQAANVSHQTIWASVARSFFASSDYRFVK